MFVPPLSGYFELQNSPGRRFELLRHHGSSALTRSASGASGCRVFDSRRRTAPPNVDEPFVGSDDERMRLFVFAILAILLAAGCEKECEGNLHSASVLVAKRDLRAGEVPTSSDVERSTICTHNPADPPVSSPAPYDGKPLTRAIPKGKALFPGDFGEGREGKVIF